jgi:hypothetical protein
VIGPAEYPSPTDAEMQAAWEAAHPEGDPTTREREALAELAAMWAQDQTGVVNVVAALAWTQLTGLAPVVDAVLEALGERSLCWEQRPREFVAHVLALLACAGMVEADIRTSEDDSWVEFTVANGDIADILRAGAKAWVKRCLPQAVAT